MDFTRLRALSSLFSMVDQGIRNIQQYNQSHFDFPMQVLIEKNSIYFSKSFFCYFLGLPQVDLRRVLRSIRLVSSSSYFILCKVSSKKQKLHVFTLDLQDGRKG